jgi:hypothetical protein
VNNRENIFEAAKQGKFNTINPEFLTEKNLTTQNEAGNTPLHFSARYENLNQIPKEILTKQNIQYKFKKTTNTITT